MLYKRLVADARFAGYGRVYTSRSCGSVSLHGDSSRLPSVCVVWPCYRVDGGEVVVSSVLVGVDDSGLSELQCEGLLRAVWDLRMRRVNSHLYIVGVSVSFV